MFIHSSVDNLQLHLGSKTGQTFFCIHQIQSGLFLDTHRGWCVLCSGCHISAHCGGDLYCVYFLWVSLLCSPLCLPPVGHMVRGFGVSRLTAHAHTLDLFYERGVYARLRHTHTHIYTTSTLKASHTSLLWACVTLSPLLCSSPNL